MELSPQWPDTVMLSNHSTAYKVGHVCFYRRGNWGTKVKSAVQKATSSRNEAPRLPDSEPWSPAAPTTAFWHSGDHVLSWPRVSAYLNQKSLGKGLHIHSHSVQLLTGATGFRGWESPGKLCGQNWDNQLQNQFLPRLSDHCSIHGFSNPFMVKGPQIYKLEPSYTYTNFLLLLQSPFWFARQWEENVPVCCGRGNAEDTGLFLFSFCVSFKRSLCCVPCWVAQLCLTLWDPKDCSASGSSVREDSPGKTTMVGCHDLLQGTFPTQGSNPGLPCFRWILYRLSQQGNPRILEWVAYSFSRGTSWPSNWSGSPAL